MSYVRKTIFNQNVSDPLSPSWDGWVLVDPSNLGPEFAPVPWKPYPGAVSQGKSSSLHFLSMCTEQKHLLFPGKKGWVHWHLIEAKIQLNTRYNAVGRPTTKDWGTLNAHRATAENSCSVLLKWNSELHSPTLKIQYCFMQRFWNQALVLTK